MSVSFLKHYYNFSITFSVTLISISGTGKVDSRVGSIYKSPIYIIDIYRIFSFENI